MDKNHDRENRWLDNGVVHMSVDDGGQQAAHVATDFHIWREVEVFN